MPRRPTVGAVVLALALAGCGGGPDGDVRADTTASSSPTATPRPGAAEPVCEAVDAAALSRATGAHLVRAADAAGQDGTTGCTFRPVSGTGRVALVDIDEPGTDLGVFADALRDGNPDAAPVDGDPLAQAGTSVARRGRPAAGTAYVRRGERTVTYVLVMQDGTVARDDLRRFTQRVARLLATTRPAS